MTQRESSTLWRRASCIALFVLGMSWAVSGCSSGRDSSQIQEGHPPEWFQERHERVVRNFYGYQVRTQQRRQQLVQVRVLKTGKWWIGEHRRAMARERVDDRGQAIERDFFRMQTRQERVQERANIGDSELERAFLAAQARSQERLRLKAQESEAAQREVLRGESERRQEQVRMLGRSRQETRRLENRPLAPVRGLCHPGRLLGADQ